VECTVLLPQQTANLASKIYQIKIYQWQIWHKFMTACILVQKATQAEKYFCAEH